MAGSRDDCPPRPPSDAAPLNPEAWRKGARGKVFRPEDSVERAFAPEPMVRWLSPTGLASSAFRVLLAGIFGLYSDKRELEEVLPKRDSVRDDLSARGELWIDYVADLADGWNPTYAVASLLAQKELLLDGRETRRGDLLVMGGDQVYPFATEEEYSHRFVAPYLAALPCVTEAEPPRLYAIPGNHDWYDGLTTFMRLFCRRQWIGGWQTTQDRSYFAVKLPQGWWLWGLDIQFDFYIDRPQLDFFDSLARSEEPGKIILCTARPSWVHEQLEGDEKARGQAKRNLEYFERKIIRKHKWRLIVAISGDHHHYARYKTKEGPQQKITCGGGGAFLYPTHGLPESLEWPEDDEGPEKHYTMAEVYPSPEDSKRLRARALLVPFTNPSFWALMGVVHLLFAWMIRFGLEAAPGGGPQGVRGAGFFDLVVGLIRNPVGLIFTIIVFLALRTFARMGGWGRGASWVVGLAHTLVQVTVVITLIWALAASPPFADLPTWPFLVIFMALLGVIGGLAGSLLMGLYLWVSQLVGQHANEAFSSAHIQDYKSFLRLRIADDGSLTIFPIALDRVPRKWRPVPRGNLEDRWFESADGEVAARLIEGPITVREADDGS